MEFKYEANRIFLDNENGETIAEVTFPNLNEKVYVIDHTFVSPELRGQKVAEKLIFAVVELARTEKMKLASTCSYSSKEFERKPEYADVLQR